MFGQTSQRTIEDLRRLCQDEVARGGRGPWCAELSRRLATLNEPAPAPREYTAEEKAAFAAEIERQAQAERDAIARKLRQVGVNEQIAQAAAEGRDVIYVPRATEKGPDVRVAGAVVAVAAVATIALLWLTRK